MPAGHESRDSMLEVLGECVYQALGLKESLQDERSALESRDSDALDAALAVKGGCVQRLQDLDRRRSELCRDCGFPAGPEQMDRMLDWCDGDSRIADRWRHLMDVVADCNTLNLTNGAIIRVRQGMIDGNLAVLRGTDAANDTYEREGARNAAASQRTLAQA